MPFRFMNRNINVNVSVDIFEMLDRIDSMVKLSMLPKRAEAFGDNRFYFVCNGSVWSEKAVVVREFDYDLEKTKIRELSEDENLVLKSIENIKDWIKSSE